MEEEKQLLFILNPQWPDESIIKRMANYGFQIYQNEGEFAFVKKITIEDEHDEIIDLMKESATNETFIKEHIRDKKARERYKELGFEYIKEKGKYIINTDGTFVKNAMENSSTLECEFNSKVLYFSNIFNDNRFYDPHVYYHYCKKDIDALMELNLIQMVEVAEEGDEEDE